MRIGMINKILNRFEFSSISGAMPGKDADIAVKDEAIISGTTKAQRNISIGKIPFIKELDKIQCFGNRTVAEVVSSAIMGVVGFITGKAVVYMTNDLEKNQQLKNFRLMTDEFKNYDNGPKPERYGLSEMKISGSSEFSEEGLKKIIETIPYSGKKVVFDLREESHGLIDGRPVSWKGENNWANVGFELGEIIADERNKLYRYENHRVCEEEDICKELGVGYVRIPVTDHSKPDDKDVDLFIEKWRACTKEDSWLHFHCKAGKGRTTTFLVMNDMMHNAKNVSIEDIVRRQYLLGDVNLFDLDDLKGTYQEKPAIERTDFLRKFYEYCRCNNDGYKETWSQWQNRNNKR